MQNIYSTSKNFLLYGKYFGFYPLSFEGPARKGFWKFKKINLFPTLCSVLLLISIIYMNIVTPRDTNSAASILDYAWSFTADSSLAVHVYLMFHQVLKYKTFKCFLQHIFKIDDDVGLFEKIIGFEGNTNLYFRQGNWTLLSNEKIIRHLLHWQRFLLLFWTLCHRLFQVFLHIILSSKGQKLLICGTYSLNCL